MEIMALKILALLASMAFCVDGAGVNQFYPYGSGLDQYLEVADEKSSDKIILNLPIVYFGARKYNIWVSINGLVSFDGPLPKYDGELFPLGKEVIAPFYADVDTRSSGDVFYRETSSASELEQAALDINRVFKPETSFKPKALVIVTWVNVGSYSQNFDKANTFQLVIASNGFDSYAIFLYLDDGIRWVQAEPKENIPQVMVQAGFDAGNERYSPFVLPNSGFPEAENWDSESNAGIPGVWLFRIGQIRSIEEPSNVLTTTTTQAPEPSRIETCPTCHINAVCKGKCCKCKDGYIGNGLSCFQVVPKSAMRFSGRVLGEINDEDIGSSGLHVYISVDDARSYTAISKLKPLVGYPAQLLVPIAELMGWLFALGKEANGFSITGGVLNYTATIKAGDKSLSVQLGMNGLGPDNSPTPLRISINGHLPTDTFGYRAIFNDQTVDFVRVAKGEYKSESERFYSVNEAEFSFSLKETITFIECEKPSLISRVRHSGYYVNYNENELTARFALLSKTETSSGDVCRSHSCHYNADCLPRGESYVCKCRQGYEGNGRECRDVNECNSDENTCSQNAECINTDGGYRCQCLTGYSGDGYYCAYEEARITCRDLKCHEHALCDYRGDEPFCECKTGYKGNGYRCEPIVVSCNEADICSPNAECVYNEDTRKYECQCKEGFSGDGDSCDTPIDASCSRCSYNAQCIFNENKAAYYCQCLPGYTGDGESCQFIEDAEPFPTVTVPVFLPTKSTVRPTPVTTTAADRNSCYYNRDLCHKNAACLGQFDGTYRCVCNTGYLGTGQQCVAADCRSHSDCGENALCQYSKERQKYICSCNEGYQGDGYLCTSAAVLTCNELNVCHPDAYCDNTASGPKCYCKSGYIGDGLSCSPLQETCMTRPSLCDRNAVCTRTPAGDFVCMCNPGFRGDGSICTSLDEKGDYLLVSRGMSVFRMPFYQAGTERGRRILYKAGQTLVGLAADCRDRKFYYSDINSGTIGRASLDNSSDSQVIISGLSSPEGLAVDWVSRALYWTDSALDRIEVSDLEGKYRKIIVDKDLHDPRAIAVDPIAGKIYWTDWHRAGPKIEMANGDGSDRKVLISKNLGLPNGLTYDYYRRELCWADAGIRKIECYNLQTSTRRAMYELANYPFGLTTFRDNFYWTDWNIKSVQTIPRGGTVLGASMQYPLGGNGKAYSIEAVSSQCLPGVNKCSQNNGNCKHLCLPTGSSQANCVCPDNVDEDECNKLSEPTKGGGFLSSIFG